MSDLSSRIGPYEVVKRLGQGGMGQVFLARDPRLERFVALKRIRGEASPEDEAYQRFQREARMAANLNHPSIVQVYDLIEDEGHLYIVMEYVEGTIMPQGGIDNEETLLRALEQVADVARGLAAAHREGIVHRDLKRENVIITSEGNAKLTDFGIAKAETQQENARLTEAGIMLGTVRTMSPEQARGEDVDYRSDLFSLGTLLYERFAGQSPFDGTNSRSMLHRIISDVPTPANRVNPRVPQSLARLISHLHQKDPNSRPRSAMEVARLLDLIAEEVRAQSGGTLMTNTDHTLDDWNEPIKVKPKFPWKISGFAVVVVTLAVAAWYLLPFGKTEQPLIYVAVAEVMDRGGGEREVFNIQDAVFRALANIKSTMPVDATSLPFTPGSVKRLALAHAADEVVTAEVRCDQVNCNISLKRIRGDDNGLIWTETVEGPAHEPLLIAHAVALSLSRGYSNAKQLDKPEVEAEDYRAFLDVKEAFRTQARPVKLLLADLEKIRRSSPRFVDVYEFESFLRRYRFSTSHDQEDLEQGLFLAKRAHEMDPLDPRPLKRLIELYLETGEHNEAERLITDLDGRYPGSGATLFYRAQLANARGQTEEALQLMGAALQRQPSYLHYFELGQLEFMVGQIEKARAHLETSLELAPDFHRPRKVLATLELIYGDPARAEQLYYSLLAHSPDAETLINLGTARLLLKRYERAREDFRRALELAPENAAATLNLADCLWLTGEEERAREVYSGLIEQLEQSPAAERWQSLTVKAQALAHIDRNREAVAAISKAQQQAPNNPQVAYEASLVYCLVGDLTSAVINAEKALQNGVGPRWFFFPWFDPVKNDPQIKDLFTARENGGAP